LFEATWELHNTIKQEVQMGMIAVLAHLGAALSLSLICTAEQPSGRGTKRITKNSRSNGKFISSKGRSSFRAKFYEKTQSKRAYKIRANNKIYEETLGGFLPRNHLETQSLEISG
jgi:hypothetical protein